MGLKRIREIRYMSLATKATFWFTVSTFLQRSISMITTPFFTRMLSTEEFGIYSTYLSWREILIIFATLYLNRSLMNLFVKNNDYIKTLSSIFGLQILISTAWLIASAVFSKEISNAIKIPRELIICMFIYFLFYSGIEGWMIYSRYIYDYKKIVFVSLSITFCASVLGVISIIYFSRTAIARSIPEIAIIMLLGIVIYLETLKKGKYFFDADIWMYSLSFCIPLLPHFLSMFILSTSDKIMINYLCGSSDVAIYSIAYSTGSLISMITYSIDSSFGPYQYQKIKSQEYDVLAKRANQVLTIVGIMVCSLMFFSREIVIVFGGHKYLQSSDIVIPICLGVYFNYTFQLFSRVQQYYEKKVRLLVPSILCALLNIVLNYIFIRIYGYRAAAFTTFFSYMLFCFVHYLFYVKTCHEELQKQRLYDVQGILLISFSVIVLGFTISILNQYIYAKYFVFIIGVVICIIKRQLIIDITRSFS